MLSHDPILRAYVGHVSVGAVDGAPSACELRMVQQAEGHTHLLARAAGATVLRAMLAKQTRRMLSDFKRAAETAQPSPALALA